MSTTLLMTYVKLVCGFYDIYVMKLLDQFVIVAIKFKMC